MIELTYQVLPHISHFDDIHNPNAGHLAILSTIIPLLHYDINFLKKIFLRGFNPVQRRALFGREPWVGPLCILFLPLLVSFLHTEKDPIRGSKRL